MHLIRTAVNGLITASLAPPCATCGAILDTPLDGCVCRNCWAAVRPICPPVCDACGDPLHGRIEPSHQSRVQMCAPCQARPRVVSRTRAVGEYDGMLRDIVHALKYGRRFSIAKRLAALMRIAGQSLLSEADCVIPVPLHERRRRQRGFNQARELARRLGPPLLD